MVDKIGRVIYIVFVLQVWGIKKGKSEGFIDPSAMVSENHWKVIGTRHHVVGDSLSESYEKDPNIYYMQVRK